MLDASELFSAVGGVAKEPDEGIIARFRAEDSLDIPIELTDADLWANYVDEDLYEMDVKMREFLKGIRYRQQKKGGYKTTASMVFAWMYGRMPTASDGYACRMVHRLLRYYCTSYTDRTTYHGKAVNRVYKFSKYAGHKKRPCSLKLRLEEMTDGSNPWLR